MSKPETASVESAVAAATEPAAAELRFCPPSKIKAPNSTYEIIRVSGDLAKPIREDEKHMIARYYEVGSPMELAEGSLFLVEHSDVFFSLTTANQQIEFLALRSQDENCNTIPESKIQKCIKESMVSLCEAAEKREKEKCIVDAAAEREKEKRKCIVDAAAKDKDFYLDAFEAVDPAFGDEDSKAKKRRRDNAPTADASEVPKTITLPPAAAAPAQHQPYVPQAPYAAQPQWTWQQGQQGVPPFWQQNQPFWPQGPQYTAPPFWQQNQPFWPQGPQYTAPPFWQQNQPYGGWQTGPQFPYAHAPGYNFNAPPHAQNGNQAQGCAPYHQQAPVRNGNQQETGYKPFLIDLPAPEDIRIPPLVAAPAPEKTVRHVQVPAVSRPFNYLSGLQLESAVFKGKITDATFGQKWEAEIQVSPDDWRPARYHQRVYLTRYLNSESFKKGIELPFYVTDEVQSYNATFGYKHPGRGLYQRDENGKECEWRIKFYIEH